MYCDIAMDGKGWTLITRFSNKDNKNWMRDDGSWWYDKQVAMRTTTDPSINADMISTAFWLVSGGEFKITRSHTPLLQTTGNCLAGQTFRSKITGYGDFRNATVWVSDQCLGSCTVQYGGQYKGWVQWKHSKRQQHRLLVWLRCYRWWRWISDDDWWRRKCLSTCWSRDWNKRSKRCFFCYGERLHRYQRVWTWLCLW